MAASAAGHTPPMAATTTTSTRYELRAVARLSPLRSAVRIRVSSGKADDPDDQRPPPGAGRDSGESRLRWWRPAARPDGRAVFGPVSVASAARQPGSGSRARPRWR